MKLNFTAEALADLARIGDYIAQDSPQRAATFVEELEAKCLSLVSQPLMYPLVPRYEGLGIRRAVHGDYLIFYRTDEDTVTILHVMAGAMDYEALLFPR